MRSPKRSVHGGGGAGRTARFRRPGLGFLLSLAGAGSPLIVLFFSSLNGPDLHEALRSAWSMFFSFPGCVSRWGIIALLSLSTLAWLKPALGLLHFGLHGEPIPAGLPARVIKRMDGFPPLAIAVSITVFVAAALLESKERDPSLFFALPRLYSLMESAATGLFCGVLVVVNVENLLFPLKRLALARAPDLRSRPTSLYARIFLIIVAVVVFNLVQLFSSTVFFFQLGAENVDLARQFAAPRPTGPDPLVLRPGRVQGIKDTMLVLGIRLGAFFIVTGQLLLQIKWMLRKPLAIIQDRLAALNEDRPRDGREIEIVANDEFGATFRAINSLIRKQQGQLDASLDRLDSITRNAADPVIVYGAGNRVEAFNPAAERYFGRSALEVIGADISTVLRLGEGEGERHGTVAESGDEELRRCELDACDGRHLRFEAHVARTDSASGPVHTVILRDISKQLETEENLRKARTAAEKANRMKSEFLATMSHELRTPLNAVLGFTQLMANDRNLTPGQVERLATISRSGEHLLGLINDILDISKIEAGRSETRETVFDLERFIEDIHRMFELRCKAKGLSLYVEHVGELPRWVRGDLGKLRQVVINLVGNAVKFTAEGGIGIAVGSATDDGSGHASGNGSPHGGRVRFSVTDSGRGIPAEELAYILEPFARSSLTGNEDGSGLGLAISSRYIEMMGGKLEVESRVGGGSCFSFTIDLPTSEEAPPVEEDEIRPVAVRPGREVKALVVDDKSTNRIVLKEMLERAGFTVLEAADGREAVDRALEWKPAIVFMDIRMPVLDGYGAVEELKATEAGRAMKVFALTASAFRHDEERILASGFDGFLAKPFRMSALFRLVAERTDVELEYESGAPVPAAAPPDEAGLDWDALASLVTPGELGALGEAVAINDFAAARRFADGVEAGAPALAALVRSMAGSFDEAGLARVTDRLGGGDHGTSR